LRSVDNINCEPMLEGDEQFYVVLDAI